MTGALKAAWALTAFVILAGVLGWKLTGRAVFAVFLVLGGRRRRGEGDERLKRAVEFGIAGIAAGLRGTG